MPIHRFKLKGALKNKWLNSGIFQGDLPMDEKVKTSLIAVKIVASYFIYIEDFHTFLSIVLQ